MRLISENFVDNVEYITEQDDKTGKKNYWWKNPARRAFTYKGFEQINTRICC